MDQPHKQTGAGHRLKRGPRDPLYADDFIIKAMWQWCRLNRHQPVDEQHRDLCVKLRGYYQYYAVRYNSLAINDVLHHVRRAWHYWLTLSVYTSTLSQHFSL